MAQVKLTIWHLFPLITRFVLVVYCDTNGATVSSSAKYNSYNSSDLSYLSNGIQFPAPTLIDLVTVRPTENEEKLPEMEWFGKLYDHHRWAKHFPALKDAICRKEMSQYLEGLRNGTSWASKIYDASGRYSSQFFMGNDLWIGSSSLCQELGNNMTNSEVPPFEVNFYVAKVRININEALTPVTRQLNIAQCLPKSCKSEDVRLLMLQEPSQAKSLTVIDVRSVPGDYCIFNDVKFYIIGGAFVVTYGLIAIATIFYLFRKNCKNRKGNSKVINNNNNNNLEEGKGKSAENKKQGILAKMLLCFCFTTNAKKILNVDRVAEDSISCIHGLRFFSIAWIIMVHTYLEIFALADNKSERAITERSFLYQTVSNASFSVDTFFFISGLLVTMLYFRAAKKKNDSQSNVTTDIKKEFLHFIILILYRFLRLTPAYLFVLGVNELVLRYTHSASIFSPAMIDHITCSAYWWRNALYINNFFPQTEFCMLWSWYIANDTQFYFLAIIILAFAVKSKYFKWAGASVIIFLITSWITTFIIAMQYNFVARVEEPFALFDQLYDKPWLRIGPYLIGMLTGYLLFSVNGKLKLSPYLIICGWIVAAAFLLSLVYGLGRTGLTTPLSAAYAAFGHTAWGLAIAWITLACCWGYAGPVNVFLSFRGFLPLSRLTYCAYLIHPVIMVFVSFHLDSPTHINNIMMLTIFLGNLVTSFLLSFIVSIAFEAPVVQLLKILLTPPAKRKEEPVSTVNS